MSYAMPSSDVNLVCDLMKAINGEYHAICFYEQLAKQAPNETVHKQILEIRHDEIRHFQEFSHIYMCLTGQQPFPQLTESFPPNFRDGVVAAFKDEQETVDFYHTVARKVHDPFIKNVFEQAAADEQNHAVWFLYFMNHT